ncbi:hypothetical protein NPA08_01820 [Mycoplasmopsis citelli]|uniref:hypothetical protein n=1 Tax=Mycoplasmopsis citelli TaxID=171281 RepID=UPI0021151132|nr:hypothetical protein [Mycoplasmopsis citelli]UUD36550.1 hypothetical protein NPA08_01820 [Mycoplasmopsis citelli]
MEANSTLYDTFSKSIPLPKAKNNHPFIVKPTLYYAVPSTREQGVDYTNIELDLKFGKVLEKNKKFLL